MSAPTSLASPPAAVASRDLFGHPRGLTFLFTTEMWERFSYYGMRALLVLYMTKYLLLPGAADNVLGFAAMKRTLESLFGPLDAQPLASQIYGFYTGFVYLDAALRRPARRPRAGPAPHRHPRRRADGDRPFHDGVRGAAFCSRSSRSSSATAPSNPISRPRSADSTRPATRRRDRAYSIFYVGINLGAFFSPLVCGTLGEELGWHYGFAAAGFGMLIGLGIYLLPRRSLPPDELHKARAHKPTRNRSTPRNGARSSRCWSCSCRRPCSGRPTSSRATRSRCGPTHSPTARSIFCSGTARFRPPGFRRSIHS